MSTAVAEVVEKKSEPLFSKKNKKLITNPLDIDNPITVQVLGICSALAVTTQMKPALVMSIALLVVTTSSNGIISLLRNTIPSRADPSRRATSAGMATYRSGWPSISGRRKDGGGRCSESHREVSSWDRDSTGARAARRRPAARACKRAAGAA